jgi:DNA-binding GntR family transcriptional regulator
MEAKTQVLEAMKKEGTPLNAGKIVELTKLDRKVVDKAMSQLKAEKLINSPKRCYWQSV